MFSVKPMAGGALGVGKLAPPFGKKYRWVWILIVLGLFMSWSIDSRRDAQICILTGDGFGFSSVRWKEFFFLF